jgi:maltose/moltooligosaccharide transporter
MYASFFIRAILSITSIWWSMSKTTEILTAEEIEYIKANPLNIISPFVDIYKAVLEMPKVMWQLFWYTYSSGTP